MAKNPLLRASTVGRCARIPQRARLRRYRDAVSDKSTPEGAREFRALAHPRRAVLRVAAVAAAVQAVADGGRLRPLLPDRRCFRDEDLRADRQPEFTQIDIETSFMTEYDDLWTDGTARVKFCGRRWSGVELPVPAHAVREAMRQSTAATNPTCASSSSSPTSDRRHEDGRLEVFRRGGHERRVVALRVPGGANCRAHGRSTTTPRLSHIYGAKGFRDQGQRRPLNDEGLQSPVVKFLTPDSAKAIIERSGAQNGDIIFFGADRKKVVNDASARCARRSASTNAELGFFEKASNRAGWWTSRCYEYDEENKRYVAAITRSPARRTTTGPCSTPTRPQVLAKAYDVAMNGWELGGGSCVSTPQELQAKVFVALGISDRGRPARQVRLPARRAAVWRAAARRHRVRPRPHRHHDVRSRIASATSSPSWKTNAARFDGRCADARCREANCAELRAVGIPRGRLTSGGTLAVPPDRWWHS